MGIAYNTNIVRDGLVLHLDAANVKSYPGTGNTWYDLKLTTHTPSLTNGVSYSSLNLGRLGFDGINDVSVITTPYSSGVSGITWEVWISAIRGAAYSTDYGYILHNNSVANTTGTSHLTIGIDAAGRYYGAFNGRYSVMFSDVIGSMFNIVCLALVWDGNNQIFYVNGTQKAIEATSTVTAYAIDTQTGVCNYKSLYRPVQSNLYSIKCYNKGLSATEINQNFEALRGRYGI